MIMIGAGKQLYSGLMALVISFLLYSPSGSHEKVSAKGKTNWSAVKIAATLKDKITGTWVQGCVTTLEAEPKSRILEITGVFLATDETRNGLSTKDVGVAVGQNEETKGTQESILPLKAIGFINNEGACSGYYLVRCLGADGFLGGSTDAFALVGRNPADGTLILGEDPSHLCLAFVLPDNGGGSLQLHFGDTETVFERPQLPGK